MSNKCEGWSSRRRHFAPAGSGRIEYAIESVPSVERFPPAQLDTPNVPISAPTPQLSMCCSMSAPAPHTTSHCTPARPIRLQTVFPPIACVLQQHTPHLRQLMQHRTLHRDAGAHARNVQGQKHRSGGRAAAAAAGADGDAALRHARGRAALRALCRRLFPGDGGSRGAAAHRRRARARRRRTAGGGRRRRVPGAHRLACRRRPRLGVRAARVGGAAGDYRIHLGCRRGGRRRRRAGAAAGAPPVLLTACCCRHCRHDGRRRRRAGAAAGTHAVLLMPSCCRYRRAGTAAALCRCYGVGVW